MGNHSHSHRLSFSIARILILITFAIGSFQIAFAQTRIISLSGDLDFGRIPIRSSSQRVLAISNLGDSVLTISNLDYPPLPVLTLVEFEGNWSGPIAPGATEYIYITFTPLGTTINGGSNDVDFAGYLSVESDATAGTNYIAMSGVGTWPPLAASLNLDFGSVPLGDTREMMLSLTNTGTMPVTVTNLTLPDGFFSGFWSSGTIQPGSATNISVVFQPAKVTNYDAVAVIGSDATDAVLVLTTPNGNVTNSSVGSILLGVSGSGTYPSGKFIGLFAPTNSLELFKFLALPLADRHSRPRRHTKSFR